MKSKFFALILIVLLTNAGEASCLYVPGEYARAFEDEVTRRNCSNLLCQPVNMGGKWVNSAYIGSVEVGHSYGSGGRTAHYENRQIPYTYRTSDEWRCKKCSRSIPSGRVFAPTVKISRDGDTIEMSINSCCASPPCRSAFSDTGHGDNHLKLLREIGGYGGSWEASLGSKWESARSLDNKIDNKITCYVPPVLSPSSSPGLTDPNLLEETRTPTDPLSYKVTKSLCCVIS